MKIKNLYIGLALAFYGCSGEMPGYPEKEVFFQISVEQNSDARNAVLTNWTDGTEIGVYFFSKGGLESYQQVDYTNQKWTYNATENVWNQEREENLKLNDEEGWGVAYYPYSGDVTDYTAIPVTAGMQDYMYSGWVKNINIDNPVATFTMKHVLVKLIFKFRMVNIEGPKTLQELRIKSNGLATSGTFDATDGVCYTYSGNGIWTYIPIENAIVEGQEITLEWMALPTGLSNTIQVIFMVNNEEYTKTITIEDGINAGEEITCTLVRS